MIEIAFWGQNQSSFQKASEIIYRICNINLSYVTVMNITKFVGKIVYDNNYNKALKIWEDRANIEIDNSKKKGTLYIQADGATVNTRIEDENGYYLGTTYHSKRMIELARYINNVKISNNEIIETLLHEINHAVLNIGQYLNLSHDEPLIEWIARCYYSILFNQKIFKDYD